MRFPRERKAAMKTRKRLRKKKAPVLELRLYIANATPRSVLAQENLQSICAQFVHREYRLSVIDLIERPEQAGDHEIMAIPTLVRVQPGLEKTVIGGIRNSER